MSDGIFLRQVACIEKSLFTQLPLVNQPRFPIPLFLIQASANTDEDAYLLPKRSIYLSNIITSTNTFLYTQCSLPIILRELKDKAKDVLEELHYWLLALSEQQCEHNAVHNTLMIV